MPRKAQGAGASRSAVGGRALLVALVVATLVPVPQSLALTDAGAWTATDAGASARTRHTATVLGNGKILVAGGDTGGTAELFEPSTSEWMPAGTMAVVRSGHTATVLEDGTVLLAGGTDSTQDGAEIYDPASNTWITTGDLGFARTGHTATRLDAPACEAATPPQWCGLVLVVGGSSQPQAELFDPESQTWTQVAGPPVKTRVSGHTATLLRDGRVLVVGGVSVDAQPIAEAEIYDPSSATWNSAENVVALRADHSATLLWAPACEAGAPPQWCGKVMVAGGANLGVPRFSAVVFNPAADRFDNASPMLRAQHGHSATLLADGRVLVAGGDDENSGSQLYDPVSGTWAYTGPLRTHRFHHASVMLPGASRVLATGGTGANGQPIASAELYDPDADTRPGPVTELEVFDSDERARTVTLQFKVAGEIYGGPPPARDYDVRQADRPINTALRFRRAARVCPRATGRLCRVAPDGLDQKIKIFVPNVLPDATYYFAVRAVDSEGVPGPRSASVKAVMGPIPPGPIKGLSAAALSSSKIRVKWRATGVDGLSAPPSRKYIVRQSRRAITSETRWRKAKLLCGGVCAFRPERVGDLLRLTVTGLRPGTTYHYAVRAKDDAGNVGPRSGSVNARTHS